jgi:hypothetical protein
MIFGNDRPIVSDFEILPDGTIRIHAAPPVNPSCNETDDPNVNEWDRDYGKPAA